MHGNGRNRHLWSGWGNVSLIHWKNCGPKAVLDLRAQQLSALSAGTDLG